MRCSSHPQLHRVVVLNGFAMIGSPLLAGLRGERTFQAVRAPFVLDGDRGAAAPLDQGDTQVQGGAVGETDASYLLRMLRVGGSFVTNVVRQCGVHGVPLRESFQALQRGSTTGSAHGAAGVADGALVGPMRSRAETAELARTCFESVATVQHGGRFDRSC
jgi:hypothetical protein